MMKESVLLGRFQKIGDFSSRKSEACNEMRSFWMPKLKTEERRFFISLSSFFKVMVGIHWIFHITNKQKKREGKVVFFSLES